MHRPRYYTRNKNVSQNEALMRKKKQDIHVFFLEWCKYKHIVKYYTEHAYGGNWANWGL